MASGQKLSFSDIEQLWIANGGPAGWAPLMAGIAIAESGGNTVALNDTPATGDYSVGLWQINYYNGLLSGRTAAYGSPAALQADPNLQAKAAISLFGGGPGISNWKGDATYKAWTAAGSPSQPSAATVQGWLGGAGGGGGGSSSAVTASSSSVGGTTVGGNDLKTCVFQAPGFLFFSGPCFLTKGGVKWLSGAACIVAGAAIGGFGIVLLASAIGKSTGATAVAKKGARTAGIGGALLAGQPEVAAGIKAGTKAPVKTARAKKQAQAQQQAESQRKAGVEGARRRLEARRRLAARSAERNRRRNPGVTTARNARQAQREGERSTDRAGLSVRGPGDRRTGRERLRVGDRPF